MILEILTKKHAAVHVVFVMHLSSQQHDVDGIKEGSNHCPQRPIGKAMLQVQVGVRDQDDSDDVDADGQQLGQGEAIALLRGEN